MELRIKNYEFGLKKPTFKVVFLFVALSSLFFIRYFSNTYAAVNDEIVSRQQQIDEIQKQIDAYQQEIETNHSKARTLETEIGTLNAQIHQLELTIRSLGLSINQTSVEISDTESKISDAENKIAKHRNAIAEFLKLTYESDQKTLTEIMLSTNNLSDFFNAVNDVRLNQEKLKVTIDEINKLKTDLEMQQNDLEDKKSELERSLSLEAVEKKSLDKNKSTKNTILKDTKGQESKFQDLVKKSQKNIEAIRKEITYLEQNGVSAEEAVKYGNLAAIAAGIRPAFLLAELEQESGLGINVGRCYITDTTSGASRNITTGKVYARGINPTRDLALFVSITTELGRDPLQTPISCWPGSGWGGAMGPAQFIPSTWMGYRAQISQITGHNPADPWSIEDAFVAAATKLANGGASSKTRAGEVAASKAYYCGKSTSTNRSCINYANQVQNKAAEIEKDL